MTLEGVQNYFVATLPVELNARNQLRLLRLVFGLVFAFTVAVHLLAPTGSGLLDTLLHAATIGLDYEYRVNRLLGVGVVGEYAFEPIESTTLLGVVDVHIWRGFAVQIGPGAVVDHEGEGYFVFRFGGLYEFELPHGYTVSPQMHFDEISGEADEFVYGIAFGKSF